MKYIEVKNLCQGKRPYNNVRPNGCVLTIVISILIWGVIIFALFGCRAGYNSPRHTGYVTETPVNIMAEIPITQRDKPLSGKLEKKMKQGKQGYIMPQYKRVTNYRK